VNPNTQYWEQTARKCQADAAGRLWRRHSDAINARLLARWLPESGNASLLKTDLFDEAVGDGLLSRLGERSALSVGMDVSEQVLLAARSRCPGAVRIAADVRQLPFADDSFDCVVSISTLDHFASHAEVHTSLVELRRVLRPGGLLVLTMDNLNNPVVWLRNVVLFPWLHRVGIVPYYVGKTAGQARLRNMVTSAGLEVRAVEATLHCPRVLAVSIAKRLSRADDRTQKRFLEFLMDFERLAHWPFRFVTGYFVAVRAVKPWPTKSWKACEQHATEGFLRPR
jgi:SAM-dependent methyltransferase